MIAKRVAGDPSVVGGPENDSGRQTTLSTRRQNLNLTLGLDHHLDHHLGQNLDQNLDQV